MEVGKMFILNNKASSGLPSLIGQRCIIVDDRTSGLYDYQVAFDDKDKTFVRDSELNALTDDDKKYMKYIYTYNKVIRKYTNKVVEIIKVDYLNKKVEITDENGVESVIGFDDLQPIHNDNLEEDAVTNSEIYKRLLQEKYDVYIRKNADYGNSFEDQFNEYGLLSGIIRLDDKLRRLKQLRNSEAKVKDESIRDTALDMANYADMLVMALDKTKNK